MKTTIVLLFALAAIFTLALFYNITEDRSSKSLSSQDKMFFALLEDKSYRDEFMATMKSEYPEEVLVTAHSIGLIDNKVQSGLINQMVAMCYSDPHMSRMMAGMMMNMCDMDNEICNTMSEMMLNHPQAMKCMLSKMHASGIINKNCTDNAFMNIDTDMTSRP